MDIQKTSGGLPLVKPSTAFTPTAPMPAAAPTTPVLPQAASLIAAAGLPADKLSASILSFARFFSLPLKPELMAEIRRQSLTPPQTAPEAPQSPSTKAETAAKNREALSLAAAAAESKGVELRPKGLEAFAEAIDPDWQRRHDSRRHNSEKRDRRKGQNLKEITLESAGKDPLLAILNRLPGKNGQRWIVLPFSFCESGCEYTVSFRILLEAYDQAPSRAACIALDIAAQESSETKSWRKLFVLESTPAQLSVYLQPELPPKDIESFIHELSELTTELPIKIPPERVFIEKYSDFFPGETNHQNNLLHSVSEAV